MIGKPALVAVAVFGLILTGCSSPPPHRHTAPATAPATAPGPAPSALPTAWPGYHFDNARTGAVQASLPSGPAHVAWSADLGGTVQGQPVAADGRIIAATEANRIVALDPSTGAVLWSRSLGHPLTNVQSVAGCGDIDPLGITSTPVVDTETGIVYVVGEVSDGGSAVHHELAGLDMATGKLVLSDNVDPPLPTGESPVNLLQRASLALANGRIYIGYGGNFGDCGHYHGWLVSVATTGAPDLAAFEVASDGEGGAIWQGGGAPAIDADGNVYVSTGNANPDPPAGGPDPKHYTESVVKLSPKLVPLASFKDRTAGGDDDLGTSNPVLLPDGNLFAVGKTNIGYVLTQKNLSKVAAIHGVCSGMPAGGPAFDAVANRIYVACRGGGIRQIDLSDDSLGTLLSGADGPPILVGRMLWALEYPEGKIFEYDADSGATVQTVRLGASVPTFATPSTAFGLVLVGTDSGVAALAGP